MQTLFETDKGQKFLQKSDAFNSHIITVQVMAIADMSPPHQHAIGTILQCP